MSAASIQERVFELVGISDVDAHIDAYAGHPEVQDSLKQGLVAKAMQRIAPYVTAETSAAPVIYSERYSEELGCSVYFKDETELSVGSFKLRGALNKVLSMTAQQREDGIVTVSAGNHAQGVAKAAQIAGSRATVFMPLSTPAVKIAAVESLEAEVMLVGQTFEEANVACNRYREKYPQQTFIHPFDDEAVVAGQGTVGHEVFAKLADDNLTPTHVFVPVGGGGLLAGTYLASQEAGLSPHLFGVEPAGSAAHELSARLGRRACLESVHTNAEGAAVAQIGELPYSIIASAPNITPLVVSEEDLLRDMVTLNEHFQKPVECTGSLAFSGMQAYAEKHGFNPEDVVVAIISGKHRNEAAYAQLKQSLFSRNNRLTRAS